MAWLEMRVWDQGRGDEIQELGRRDETPRLRLLGSDVQQNSRDWGRAERDWLLA